MDINCRMENCREDYETLESLYKEKVKAEAELEVLKILNALDNKKHRAILFMIYSAGLRVGEVVRLKITDIDSDRMLIYIIACGIHLQLIY